MDLLIRGSFLSILLDVAWVGRIRAISEVFDINLVTDFERLPSKALF